MKHKMTLVTLGQQTSIDVDIEAGWTSLTDFAFRLGFGFYREYCADRNRISMVIFQAEDETKDPQWLVHVALQDGGNYAEQAILCSKLLDMIGIVKQVKEFEPMSMV